VTRYTFLVQVHPDGISTLENLSTHERIQIVDFAAIGPQIEAWLAGLAVRSTLEACPRATPSTAPHDESAARWSGRKSPP
jgi:hypothetical protein